MLIPTEVLVAKKAYYEEYNKIKAKVLANKKKYIGTEFEDCPPLIKEQGQFFVSGRRVKEERERLIALYGECPLQWAIWVTWYKKHNEENSVQKERV